MKWKILALAAVAALGMLGAGTMADTISATFDSTQPLSENVTAVDPLATSGSESTAAGLWHFTITGGDPSQAQAKADLGLKVTDTGFYALCIDFAHNIGYGTTATWNTLVPLTTIQANTGNSGNGVGISSHQAAAIGYLFTQYSLNSPTPSEKSLDPGGSAANWAATLQMAVWDILYTYTTPTAPYQTSLNLKRNIAFSGAPTIDITDATTLAANAYGTTNSTEGTDVLAMTSTSGTQNFTYLVIADNPFVSTPLPRTAPGGLVLLAGLAGFGLLRRRQRLALSVA